METQHEQYTEYNIFATYNDSDNKIIII